MTTVYVFVGCILFLHIRHLRRRVLGVQTHIRTVTDISRNNNIKGVTIGKTESQGLRVHKPLTGIYKPSITFKRHPNKEK